MNFFAQQDRARTQTRRMLILFVIAVICIVGAIDLVVAIAFGTFGNRHHEVGAHSGSSGVLIMTSLIVLAIIGFSTLYKVTTLRGGGGVVARQLGATLIDPHDPAIASNFAYKRLRNVVEEIAIASGVPVPEIYVLQDEHAINAFASGYTPADAAVTVTEGCLEKLTRDELQGVIAHEFSHVLNGDMRLNIRLMGVLFGILVIGIAGQKMVEWSGRDRDSGWQVGVGIAIVIVGSIGLFFGRLIKAGVSRQREFLADASAVQFTRQTRGISGALKKIGGLPDGSKLASSSTEEVAHMLFGDGVGYSALFATHPPLHQRILAIDPQFNPQELEQIAAAWSNPVQTAGFDGADDNGAEVSISGMAPVGMRVTQRETPTSTALPQVNADISLTPKGVIRQVAAPGSDDYQAATAIHGTISEHLRTFAYMQERSTQVVFALALDAQADMRERQLRIVEKYYDAGARAGVEEIAAEVANLHPLQRLPLAQLAFPSLRRRPREQLQTFLAALNELIQADGEVQLEEYCLAKLVGIQVVDALAPSKSRTAGNNRIADCARELAVVIATIARYGNDDDSEAERAYLLGMHEVLPEAIDVYTPPADFAAALDQALPKLDLLDPSGKELVVRGLTRAIGADGIVAINEAELLRTICAALHCPLPPQLDLAA
jgi:Zn-dependent protease with chaperone function